MGVVIRAHHLLAVVEAEAVVTAGAVVPVDPDHLLRGKGAMIALINDQGALKVAGAPSIKGVPLPLPLPHQGTASGV